MSNFDRIKEMSLDEMEEFLQDAEYRSPWAEEFAEARCKTCKPDQDVLEEMADTQIMLNQMCLIFGDFNEQEIEKLERLDARLREAGA